MSMTTACIQMRISKAFQELDQSFTVFRRHVNHGIAMGLRLSAMPQYRLQQGARPPVMQQVGVAGDLLGQPDPPERRRPPFPACRSRLGTVVGKAGTHVMKEQICVGPDQAGNSAPIDPPADA